jgi:hypothetical protein
MPQYKVDHYNDESRMLHSTNLIYAADEDSARKAADEKVMKEGGYGVSSDGHQATMSNPRFRVAVTEVE